MAYKTDVNRKEVKKKVQAVDSAVAEMKKYKTVALLDLRKLPDALFQSLRKRIREEGGRVLVLKKPVISRVLASNPILAKRVEACNNPVALILTNMSSFEVNSFFKQNRKKRAAKVGDIALADIVVPEGETDLPPGPALSELKAGGLNVQIKAGKIAVVKDSTVAKKGEKLTEPKVKALQTLNVMPFEIMANLLFGFDGQYIYSKELLDSGETVREDLAHAMSQAMNVSLNASYPTEQNISLLLSQAVREAVNVSLNGSIYSSSSIGQLLGSAYRQASALESMSKK
ncbi:MAG TPA: 50S ribosomal protein L10 [Candidatus Bilamarchaeum sp.]|nr:50S ribosomal protein L10 [Candidatus Bilamarchaeum sp.]